MANIFLQRFWDHLLSWYLKSGFGSQIKECNPSGKAYRFMNFHMDSEVSIIPPIRGLSLDDEWNLNNKDVRCIDPSEMFIAKPKQKWLEII